MIASAQPAWKNQLDRRHRLGTGLLLALTLLASASSQLHAQEPGITPTALRVGGIMDLQGASSARGQAMKAGVEAALKNEKIQGRSIESVSYTHLDVYKRQALPTGLAGRAGCRCRKSSAS